MKSTALKITGLALAAAFTAFTGRADIPLNQNVALYGYAAGFLEYNQNASGDNSSTGMDLRAARLGVAFNFAPVTAKLSAYYTGGDFYLLDANATYNFGNGVSLTGGRFLSKFGYEPFDIPSGFFITNGADAFGDIFGYIGATGLSLMPNFHEGARLEYVIDAANTIGISFVDSLYNGTRLNASMDPNGSKYLIPVVGVDKFRGDGSLSDGYGIEAYYRYNSKDLSIGATAGYQTQNQRKTNMAYLFSSLASTLAGDIWAQYIIDGKTLIAAEFFYRSDSDKDTYGPGTKLGNLSAYYGLVTVKQNITDQFSLAGRFSYGNLKWDDNDFGLGTSKANFWKISVTPAYTVTKNLSVCAEVNYTKYNEKFLGAKGDKNSKVYAGVQACFHF